MNSLSKHVAHVDDKYRIYTKECCDTKGNLIIKEGFIFRKLEEKCTCCEDAEKLMPAHELEQRIEKSKKPVSRAQQPSSWEKRWKENFGTLVDFFGNDARGRVKDFIREELEEQKQGMIEAIEQVRNSDTFVFLDPHVSNRAFDNAVEIIRKFKS